MPPFNRKENRLKNRIPPFLFTGIPDEEPTPPPPRSPNPKQEPTTALEERQQDLGHYVRMVAKGVTHGLFIYGAAGGLGKSETVKRVLASEGIVPVLVNSHATPLGLYQTLYKFRHGSIVFIDDADSMYEEKRILGILRSALWGNPRVCTYISSKLPDELPSSFEFDSSIIMASNTIPKNAAFKAVLSRISIFELKSTNAEVIKFMRVMADRGIPGVIKEEAMAVIDFIEEETGTRQLSLRLLILSCKILVYARENGLDWKDLVRTQLNALGDRTVDEFDSLANDLECMNQVVEQFPKSPRQQQTMWSKMTKKSRATFYRVQKKFDEERDAVDNEN
jgi:hypothetical protein